MSASLLEEYKLREEPLLGGPDDAPSWLDEPLMNTTPETKSTPSWLSASAPFQSTGAGSASISGSSSATSPPSSSVFPELPQSAPQPPAEILSPTRTRAAPPAPAPVTNSSNNMFDDILGDLAPPSRGTEIQSPVARPHDQRPSGDLTTPASFAIPAPAPQPKIPAQQSSQSSFPYPPPFLQPQQGGPPPAPMDLSQAHPFLGAPSNMFPTSAPTSMEYIPSIVPTPPEVPSRTNMMHYDSQQYFQHAQTQIAAAPPQPQRQPPTRSVAEEAGLSLQRDFEVEIACLVNAIENKDPAVVKETLDRTPFLLQAEVGSGGRTLYHVACEKGSLQVVQLVREKLGGQTAIDRILALPRPDGWSPVALNAELFAVADRQDGSRDVVDSLLELGADLTAKDMYGRTILHVASAKGNAPLVKHLLRLSRIDEELSEKKQHKANSHNANLMDFDMQDLRVALEKEKEEERRQHEQAARDEIERKRLLQVKQVQMQLQRQRGSNWKPLDVNARDDDGATPLYEASGAGHVAVAKLLLSQPQIDVNLADKDKATPLYLAAQNNHLEMVQLLLAEKSIDPNFALKNGATPLHIAVYNAHLEVVNAMLKHPAIDVNYASYNGATLLVLACYCGHEAVVETLLQVPGIDINKAVPLYIAAEKGYIAIVKRLLAQPQIDINAVNAEGWTPLCIAAQNGHEAIVELLLSRPGIEPQKSIKQTGTTPLLIAARNNQARVVRRLLKHFETRGDPIASVVNDTNASGWTPLLIATEKGCEAVVRELLAIPGVDINKSLPPLSLTPLHLAAQKGRKTIASLLLSEGADTAAKTTPQVVPATTTTTTLAQTPTSPNSPRPTVASTAAKAGRGLLALVSKPAAPAATTTPGGPATPAPPTTNIPIHLINENMQGETPEQIAERLGHHDVAELIGKFESKIPQVLLQRVIALQRQLDLRENDAIHESFLALSSPPASSSWQSQVDEKLRSMTEAMQRMETELNTLRQENQMLKSGLQKMMTALQTGFNTVYSTILDQRANQPGSNS